MRIVVVETNRAGNGVRAMQYAKEVGIYTHFVSASLAQYMNMCPNPAEIADEVTEVNTYDVTKLLHMLASQTGVAVLAFDEYRCVQAAICNKVLDNGYGPSVESLIKSRFKDLFRAMFVGTDLEVPYRVVGAELEVEALREMLPCVVKPVDASGGVGVKIFDNSCLVTQQVADYNAAIRRDLLDGYAIDQLLIEQYVEGDEYSGELAWDEADHRWVLIGCAKKYVDGRYPNVEVKHIFPCIFAEKDRSIVERALFGTLDSLGLSRCVAHVEFKVFNHSVRVIEVNPRPAGGHIVELVSRSSGIDLCALHVQATLGIPIRLSTATETTTVTGIAYLLPEQSWGCIKQISLPEIGGKIVRAEAKKAPFRPNDIVDNDARIAFVIATGKSLEEVSDTLDASINSIKLV